jgi:dipeptidyl aminopeptidase/acylaminoacyl peptidase
MRWLKWTAVGLALTLGELALSNPALAQDNEPVPATSVAPATQNSDYLEQLPPLIDRNLFFGNPQISGAQLSPNGEFLAFIKPLNGTRNIWIKGINEPFDAARPVTAEDSPIPGYFWSADGSYILYPQDRGGNENFHIYAVDPTAEPARDKSVPPARDLTPYEQIQARIYAVPEETPNFIIVGLNDRNPQLHDVYRVNLATGERTLLVKNDREIASWTTDLEGDVRLATRIDADGGTEILQVDGDSWETVYTCSFEETCNPIRFHKDSDRVYMETNKGKEADLTRLILFNPETQESELVSVDPKGEVDFGRPIFSEATDELIATVYVGDRQRIYPEEEDFARDLALLKENLPDGNFAFRSATNDSRLRLVGVERDVDPGSMYLFNRETGKIEKLYESRPELPSEHLASMQAIRYTARDGTEIPAYLTLPKGVEPRNLPVVVHPHGGPWARDTWGYNAYVQFLANRGYAVLQPNFRGSTGYGQGFLNAGNEEWGRGIMQQDITDGVNYLIEEGIADPERVGIFGGSYGGYATLAGLAFTPELYAAGISFVGPSNLITLIQSVPPYWEPIKQKYLKRVGNPNNPEDRSRLRRQSPLFSAEQIDDPLLVIQGANDPRVPKAESDQIVVAVRESGQEVQYLVAPNEGHGFRKEDNRLAVTAAIERFFARHLGGRYQESLSPEIEARLEALRVDVDEVTAPESVAREEKGD